MLGLAQSSSVIQLPFVQPKTFNTKDSRELKPVQQKNLGKITISTNKVIEIDSIYLNSRKLNIPFTTKKYKINYEPGISLNKEYVFIKPKKYPLLGFNTKDNLKYAIKFLDVKCGLPSNKIIDIVFDNNNLIWIAYDGGVAKLSPNSVSVYNAKVGFPDYQIKKIAWFDNKLLVGTFGGGLIELGEDYYAVNNQKTGFKTNLVLDIAVNGPNIYVATYGNGIYYINNLVNCYKILCPILQQKENSIISSITINNNNLFIALNNGFARLNNKEFTHINFKNSKPIDHIFTTSSSQVYICSENEIKYFNNFSLYAYQNEEFQSSKVNDIIKSKSGSIWLATNKGILKIEDSVAVKFTKAVGLPENNITGLIQDDLNNLWFTTLSNGIGIWSPSQFNNIESGNSSIGSVFYNDKKKLCFVSDRNKIVIKDGSSQSIITHPLLSEINYVYFSSNYQAYFIASSTGLYKISNNVLYKIETTESNDGLNNQLYVAEDGNANIYVANYNFGLIKLNGTNFEIYNNWKNNGNTLAYAIVTKGAQVWALCDNGNLSLFNGDSIKNYNLTYKKNPIKFFQGVIDSLDNIFIATNIGVVKFSKGIFNLLEANSNSMSSRVNSITRLNDNTIVAGTNNSLVFIKDSTVKFYNESYGLNSSAFKFQACASLGNKAAFVSSNGIIEYKKFNFASNKIQRKIFLDKVELFTTGIELDSLYKANKVRYDYVKGEIPYGLRTPPELNKIKFSFFSNDWGKENLIKYYYKLLPTSESWNMIEGSTLLLNNLASNVYTLEVHAFLADGAETTSLSYEFEVLTPFYKKTWFISLCFTLLLILAYFIFVKFSTFKFESVLNYGNDGYLIQKVRLLAIMGSILTAPIDYYYSEISGRYIVMWPVNFFILIMCLSAYLYTYAKKVEPKYFKLTLVIGYLIIVVSLIYRLHINNYDPILSIESALVYLFVLFIIQEVRWLFAFSIGNLALIITLLFISDANIDNKSLYVSAVIQALITIHIFYFIEEKKLQKVIFSDLLLQNTQQFVIVADLFGEIIYVNEFTLKTLQLTNVDVYKNAWWDYRGMSPQQIKDFKIECAKTIRSNQTKRYINVLNSKKNNKDYTIEWIDTPVEGKYLLGIGKDITTETEQREELEELSLVAQTVSNGVIILNAENKITWANTSFLEIVEYNLDEIIGVRPIEKFSGEQTNNGTKEEIQLTGGRNSIFDILIHTKYGKSKWLNVTNTSIYNEQGVLEKQIEIVQDITDIKKLRANYKHILKNAAEIIFTTDFNGNFVYINDTVETILGYTASELIGHHFSSIIEKNHQRKINLFYLKQFKNNLTTTKQEFKVIHKSGKTIWVSQTVSVILDEKNQPSGFQAVVSDITEKKNYELELSRLSVVATNTDNLVVITNAIGLIEWVNQCFVNTTGYTLEESLNQKLGEFLQGELTNKETIINITNALKNKQSFATEILNYKKNGETYWLHLSISPIFDKDGELKNYVAIESDISERKQRELIIENQNSDILASINYAKRIQTALLPSLERLQNLPYHNAIFYKPKDIIGGDFYWTDTINNHLIIAVGDCTGHGVPGALMTLIGINGLINSVSEAKETSPAAILNYLDNYIYELIRPKDDVNSKLNDSIDMAIISINLETNKIKYSLACRPIVCFEQNNLLKLEGSKKSVGSKILDEKYLDFELPINVDRLYMFSDGLVDQFGGNPTKRLKSKGFLEILEKANTIKMCEQTEYFENFYSEWMNGATQTDDMILFGINIKEKK